MIQAKNIQKAYENLQVLKGVDLTIQKGEIVSIVGKSGAGKSTLLHILGTLDIPDDGFLSINGIEINTLSEKELSVFRNQQIGFVFQFHHLLPEFTALENVCIPAYIQKKPEKETIERAKKLLADLGLEDRLQHKPAQLSGGEQQRVAVARAMMNKPAVILADEPSGNLDTETSQQLHELFFELRAKHQQTFIIVTHNPDLAKMSDRTLVMKDGCIIDNQINS